MEPQNYLNKRHGAERRQVNASTKKTAAARPAARVTIEATEGQKWLKNGSKEAKNGSNHKMTVKMAVKMV